MKSNPYVMYNILDYTVDIFYFLFHFYFKFRTCLRVTLVYNASLEYFLKHNSHLLKNCCFDSYFIYEFDFMMNFFCRFFFSIGISSRFV